MKRSRIRCFCAAVLGMVLVCSCVGTAKTENPDFPGDYPPQYLGILRLNIVKRFSNDLLPRDISFVFEPASNVLKFHHKMMGDNIWIYLTKENRMLFKQAIEQYLADFASKNLTVEGSKKKGIFGKTDAFMTWGLAGSVYEAEPVLRFEYQFITPQRPYFILANATVKGSEGTNAPAIRVAISPAQCKDILEFFDEQNFLQLVAELKAEYEKFDVQAADIADIESRAQETDIPTKEETVPFDNF